MCADKQASDPGPEVSLIMEIRGGCLVDTYCSDSSVRVILVDWDTEGSADHPDVVRFTDDDGLQVAFVSERVPEPLGDLSSEVVRALRAAGIDLHGTAFSPLPNRDKEGIGDAEHE